jgi:hypothetical protein
MGMSYSKVRFILIAYCMMNLFFYSQCLIITALELTAATTPIKALTVPLSTRAIANTETKKYANIAGIMDKHRRKVLGCI